MLPLSPDQLETELRRIGAGNARGEVIRADDFTPGRLSITLGDLDGETRLAHHPTEQRPALRVGFDEQGLSPQHDLLFGCRRALMATLRSIARTPSRSGCG